MIYTEIIQPLIGEVFEVDAALNPSDPVSESESINELEEQSCSCCVSRTYRPSPIRDQDGSMASQGECDFYFEKIYTGDLIENNFYFLS